MDTGRKDANIQIGKRLREARLNMNLEKSEIADVLGVTVEHYRKLEAGITGISVDKVLTLYHKYGIDPTYLITGESSIKGMDIGWIYHCCNYMDICQQHKKSVSESCDSFDCAYTVIILL